MAHINLNSLVLLAPVGLAISMLLNVDLIARISERKANRPVQAERAARPKSASDPTDAVVRANSLTARMDQ